MTTGIPKELRRLRRPARVRTIWPTRGIRHVLSEPLPASPTGPAAYTSTDMPPDIQALAQRIGERQARLVWRMQQRLGTTPSAAELLVYDWLERNRVPFRYQVPTHGGRLFPGGAVQDFVIDAGDGVMVWEVQGEYWHRWAEVQRSDRERLTRLLLGRVQNRRVVRVAFLWEDDIYANVGQVCRDALAGEERRR